MASQRKIIREKIKSLLLNKTSAEARVFENRMEIYDKTELPAISIYTISEASVIYNTSPREYERTVKTVIEIVTKEKENIDDALDLFTEQIESIMHSDDSLDGVCSTVIYTGTEMTIKEEGAIPVACARMLYDIKYYAFHGIDPDTLPTIDKYKAKLSKDSSIVSEFELNENPLVPPVEDPTP